MTMMQMMHVYILRLIFSNMLSSQVKYFLFYKIHSYKLFPMIFEILRFFILQFELKANHEMRES